MADKNLHEINKLIYENLDLLGYETQYPNDFTICLKKGDKTLIVSKEAILSEINCSTGYLDYILNGFIENDGKTYHT